MTSKRTLGLYCGALALLALQPLATRASDTTPETPDPENEPQTHVLFTGNDIRIFYEGKLHPVREVEGDSLVIQFKDRDKGLGIPIAGNAGKLVVARVQTLSDRSAIVANLKYDRVYTEAKDPYRKANEAMLNAVAMADRARAAEARVRKEPEKITVLAEDGVSRKQIDNPLLPELKQDLESTRAIVDGNMGRLGTYAETMAQELALELFDALEVQFEVSSERLIQDAYVVVMAKYHTKEDPEQSLEWLNAKAVGTIDAEPRKVFLRKGGLPPGYVLEQVRVHLYEDGTEIATDLSENRVSLTRAEAHEYLIIEHVSTHKADTLPARIALTTLPEDWAGRPQGASVRKVYYVKVDQAGLPVGAFEDQACETKVAHPYYARVLMDLLFLPALEKGNPVEGVARVRLVDLTPQ